MPRPAVATCVAVVCSFASASPVWVPGPAAPAGLTPREGAAMAYDSARQRVVLFGGFDWITGPLADTWEYDGAAWSEVVDTRVPPRIFAAMGYDSSRRVMVLFGGSNGWSGFLGDAWEYDGARWKPAVTPPAGLTPREFSALGYDEARGTAVLFGGNDAMGEMDDTWEYDGASWRRGPAVPGALAPRRGHAMAYHPGRGRVVLFGGQSQGRNLGDAWEYDAAGWQGPLATPAGLVARSGHAMAYDTQRDRIVLHGGHDGVANLGDTWELDAAGAFTPGAGPAPGFIPRAMHGLAYFRSRQRVVLFGGSPGPYGLADTWEYTPWGVGFVAGEGAAPANGNGVRLFTASGLPAPVAFQAYAAGRWGTRVAAGDVDGGLGPEIVTGPGPGEVHGPQVRAFGRDGLPRAKVNFYAYGTLRYGVHVAAAGLDADLLAEILTGAGPGAIFGPHVRGFDHDGGPVAPLPGLSFFAYGTLRYGVNAAGGQLLPDAPGEILTGPGPGATFSPNVRGFDYGSGAVTAIAGIAFDAVAGYGFGANVAGGDVDGDGLAEIACAPGPGPAVPARFLGFDYDGTSVAALAGFDVTPYPGAYGGRPGLGDVSADRREDLLTAAGPDPAAASTVHAFASTGTALLPLSCTFTPFVGGSGASVESGAFGY